MTKVSRRSTTIQVIYNMNNHKDLVIASMIVELHRSSLFNIIIPLFSYTTSTAAQPVVTLG
jgi:hypothetical protein